MKTTCSPILSIFMTATGARLVAAITFMALMYGQSGATFAAPVTYHFDGHIWGGEGLHHIPSIGVNEPFFGIIAMDTASPNLVPELPVQGEFRGGTMTFSVAGKRWTSSTYPVALSISYADAGGSDIIVFSAAFLDAPESPALLDGKVLYQVQMMLVGPGGDVLADNGFPAEALAAGKFEETSGVADFYDDVDCFLCSAFLVIDHFSLAPVEMAEPSSVTLLILSIVMAGSVARRTGAVR